MKVKVLILTFFLILPYLSFGQITEDEKKTLWDYPIKPGMEEWRQLKTTKEMVDVCQIPEYVLQDISTNDLMIVCLQYPPLFNVFAFNDKNDGLKRLFTDFNGIREFSKREDAVHALRKHYLSEIQVLLDKINKSPNPDFGYPTLHISILEFLLGCSDFHIVSSTKDKKEVLESLFHGYLEKIKYPNYFRGIDFISNLFARANIITKIDTTLSEKFEGKNQSVLYSGRADADLIDTIDRLSYNLIK